MRPTAARMFLALTGGACACVGFARGIIGHKTDATFGWMAVMFLGIVVMLYALKPEGR